MLGRLHEAMKGGSRPVQAGLVEEGLFYFFYFTIYIYIYQTGEEQEGDIYI